MLAGIGASSLAMLTICWTWKRVGWVGGGIGATEIREMSVVAPGADVGVLLVHADHDSRVLRAAHNGREDSARGVVAGEASLAHSRAVVNHKGLYLIIVSHG